MSKCWKFAQRIILECCRVTMNQSIDGTINPGVTAFTDHNHGNEVAIGSLSSVSLSLIRLNMQSKWASRTHTCTYLNKNEWGCRCWEATVGVWLGLHPACSRWQEWNNACVPTHDALSKIISACSRPQCKRKGDKLTTVLENTLVSIVPFLSEGVYFDFKRRWLPYQTGPVSNGLTPSTRGH